MKDQRISESNFYSPFHRISHWDHERERIVVLTRKSLWIVKYDFIAMRILEKERHLLNKFDTIQTGPLTYPPSSVVP